VGFETRFEGQKGSPLRRKDETVKRCGGSEKGKGIDVGKTWGSCQGRDPPTGNA